MRTVGKAHLMEVIRPDEDTVLPEHGGSNIGGVEAS